MCGLRIFRMTMSVLMLIIEAKTLQFIINEKN